MIMHLSPVSSFKVLRDRRQGAFEEPQKIDVTDSVDNEAAGEFKLLMPNLLDLLCLTRNSLATDARDKIYGLLALTDDPVAQSIVPDYSLDNTPSKVFTEVATDMVEAGYAVDLLHHAGIDQSIPNLPSWVPDWTMQSRSTLSAQLYNCMPDTAPTVSILASEGAPKLSIRGAILARVNFVGPSWRYYTHDQSAPPFNSFENAPDIEIPPFNDENSRNFILSFASQAIQDDLQDRYTDEGLEDALVRTLAMDRSWQGERIGKRERPEEKGSELSPFAPAMGHGDESSTSTSKEFFAGVDAFQRFYARGPDSEEDERAPGIRVHQTAIFKWLLDFDAEVEADLQKRMVPFAVPFQEAQCGRRFAKIGTRGPKSAEDIEQDAVKMRENPARKSYETKPLEYHSIGTIPWNAQVEDYVVLLEGFRTPFILRKGLDHAEAGEREIFHIIGDCYVHGVMDGELLRPIGRVEERLKADQVGVNDQGGEYAVRGPEGYLSFQDFVIA
ncbi:hypothetical protein CORC01_10879 [Colletotrichum orchidophilum]|uniref:Heterokaryon incompatibility protein n=1 Tax=Colletotrichum orchidophilum TaxID=1209926 RepID=A0A1G4AXH2_9PEZI|nr:uncharacterized protein CORC01_10879 [Colletotrichum orchidophilum]OHE93858.1 hypothetical protein CORC01_10879 [Colletotrichum orchidophilum]